MIESTPIRVLIVDDHDMLREGLAAFLNGFPDLVMVGEAASGEEGIRLCQELQPQVVLMDLVMPKMDGVTAIKAIHEVQPEIKIIALSSFSEDKLVRSALLAGATSYLLKNVSAERLADAIRATHTGLPTLSPEVKSILLELEPPETLSPATLEPLTPRELQVLVCLAAGLTNAEIAQRLGISQYTIKGHVSNILGKLGVNSRTEAVAYALRNNLIPQ
ncbi:MAG: response regulator transcription factor [Anaerolineales bacterium]|jgi:two-component system, NarL family, response regulator LiaR